MDDLDGTRHRTAQVDKKRTLSDNKQNHSEIEKRRRDKMNKYIIELSALVPMCNAMSRKLDKLTVLRMAVQHMKTLRGSVNSYKEGQYKPYFLSDEELKRLILQAAEGFLFVVSCDRGRILYISESVSQVLNYTQSDLLGQSWLDILHPKDIAKVKEQLSSSEFFQKERLIDAKTMLPVKADVPSTLNRLSPGARRSFFCRMKCKTMTTIKEEADTTTGRYRRRKSNNNDRRYIVTHCTGYLKSWAPSKLNLPEEGESENCNMSCLVAVGRAYQTLCRPAATGVDLRQMEFVSRHAMDGKFLYVDQRATMYLGYLPQELLGTSSYEYYHQEDVPHVAEIHKQVLQSTESVTTKIYRFRTKEGSHAFIQTKWKVFKNPWTKEFEYLIAVNYLVPAPDVGLVESSSTLADEVMSSCSNSNSLDAVLSSLPTGGEDAAESRFMRFHVEVAKIGRQIAAETVHHKTRTRPAATPDPNADSLQSGSKDTINPQDEVGRQTNAATLIQAQQITPRDMNDVIGQSHDSPPSIGSWNGQLGSPNTNESESDLMDSLMGRELMQASYQNISNEGNDEAAMAVIMSLLEADAGLGGPVDFSGLPWPSP